ncbi:hypothetical protein NA56DRAFT_686849 [Hyaloscypha hepaticicola]|uniref:Uncharacterized protein n=1 Tax=Hyaloscypha hepaticicola TaxID=2082293 RepID=A0A2J6QCR8_9HELO|nr:hypothetical protein NA56DRAFT_686849 [Hyaloscypha hepaticicola]
MDSDATLGGSGSPQHGRRTRAILPQSLQRQRFQTRGWFPIQGRYTLFGTGVRRKRSLHLLSRYSSIDDCETRDSWARHELHSSPTPLEIRVTLGYSHWRASGRHPRSSIERAACALGRFLGRRRSQWAAPAFGSREEQSRADLQEQQIGHNQSGCRNQQDLCAQQMWLWPMATIESWGGFASLRFAGRRDRFGFLTS